jgi:hypothetical protein
LRIFIENPDFLLTRELPKVIPAIGAHISLTGISVWDQYELQRRVSARNRVFGGEKYSEIIRKKHFLNFFKDLSDSLFDTFKLQNEFYVYSLRSLCISTDHPLELFTLLFQIAPFLQHIQLIQTYKSSIKFTNNNQLYDCIHFVISQCQQRLKCLRRLHIQLRSVSDQVKEKFGIFFELFKTLLFQIFLQSSSVTSIPISYEVITY